MKKRLLDFVVRVNGGRMPRCAVDRLLDHRDADELDLAACGGVLGDSEYFTESECHRLASTRVGPKLRKLTLSSAVVGSADPLHLLRAFVGTADRGACLEDLSVHFCSAMVGSGGGGSKVSNSGGGSSGGVKLQPVARASARLIADHCPNLRVLRLRTVSEKDLNDKAVAIVLKHCPLLRELDLYGCKRIKGTCFSALVPSSFSPVSRKRRPRLRSLDLSCCELSKKGFKILARVCGDMQVLRLDPLRASFRLTGAHIAGLLQHCPGLTELRLTSYQFEMDAVLLEVAHSCRSGLSTLMMDGYGMTDRGVSTLVRECPKLDRLRFRYGDGVTDQSLLAVAQHCGPALKSLTLDFWNKFNQLSVSDSAIRKLLCSCTRLEELSLASCMILSGACFPEAIMPLQPPPTPQHNNNSSSSSSSTSTTTTTTQTATAFPDLRVLVLSECSQLNDASLKRIVDASPNLRRLELNNLNGLTDASLHAIGVACPQLEELHLLSCSFFADDAVRVLLRGMPRLFVQVTRYSDFDLLGSSKEVHYTTVDDIFTRYPNTFRERAFEKTRKRLFGIPEA